MTKPFDWNDVDSAFKRAAWKAVHGTREDKAGRFADAPPAAPAVKERPSAPFQAEKPKR